MALSFRPDFLPHRAPQAGPLRETNGFVVTRVAGRDVGRLQQAWLDALPDALEPSPFCDPSILQAAAVHLGEPGEVLAVHRAETGALAALFPLSGAESRPRGAATLWHHRLAPCHAPFLTRDGAMGAIQALLAVEPALVLPAIDPAGPTATHLFAPGLANSVMARISGDVVPVLHPAPATPAGRSALAGVTATLEQFLVADATPARLNRRLALIQDVRAATFLRVVIRALARRGLARGWQGEDEAGPACRIDLRLSGGWVIWLRAGLPLASADDPARRMAEMVLTPVRAGFSGAWAGPRARLLATFLRMRGRRFPER
jgi:hypothetical protein